MTCTSCPPASHRGPSHEMSKDVDAVVATRYLPWRGKRVSWQKRRTVARAECGTTTPFGRPVDPEVYMT
ncbi:hypothetical protein C1701_23720 [Actinoalloteichus sp. AHMU CJ021]|nr:hypothetical protein C1701_23720 [Actinoalloteichus sp. AHMU CJ021]